MASSEDAVTWHRFLRHYLECSPSVSILMSDGSKGVETQTLRPLLDSYGVHRARCARQIIDKNHKTAKIGYYEEDLRLLWNVVRSRTRETSDVLLSDLASRNSDLVAWFRSHSHHACAYEFLNRGIPGLDVCTSNSSEQANNFLESTRETNMILKSTRVVVKFGVKNQIYRLGNLWAFHLPISELPHKINISAQQMAPALCMLPCFGRKAAGASPAKR